MEWIDAATAAERLGVKPATLYAYVSRGVLKRRHDDTGRRSLFDAAEIEQLARRGRPRGQPPELVIESGITALGLDRPYYRGHDALTLARATCFEATAEWLWTGDPALLPAPGGTRAWDGGGARGRDAVGGRSRGDGVEAVSPGEVGAVSPPGASGAAGAPGPPGAPGPSGSPGSPGPSGATGATGVLGAGSEAGGAVGARDGGVRPWDCDPEAVRAAVAAQRDLPEGILPLDRLQVITTVLGASDSLRYHLAPEAVAATGRRLIAGLVEALPPLQEPQGASIAERLWSRVCPHPATPALIRTFEVALVLLADHELAASTLAARVAASAKADPYAVVLTGLGVLGGPLHGGASYAAERLLAEVTGPDQAPRVIAGWIRRGERIPGFGHSVYKNGDARGRLLLDLLAQAAPGHDRLAVAQAVLDEVRRRRLPERNIDFALAALVAVTGMVSGAGEAVFAIARTAGWLAHAMEEYARGSLLRLRASYVGPPIR
ncbi:citrate synthase [Nonomuraea sp. LPB2021202275-12-8]|uniref:citrate synthase n=1 Tax=Nonomuraea sp. LPB2021202275-12-8 TaxID=3120159 RepID=UPI00300C2735